MNEMERFFETASRIRGETYAAQAYFALVGLLTAIDSRWPSAGLRRHLESHRGAVLSYIQRNPAFGAILRRLFETYARDLVDRDDTLSDPTALVDFSTLVAFLAEDYPAALPAPASDEALSTLDDLQPRLATELIHAVLPQALELAKVVWRAAGFARARHAAGGRVVLLEFPVGNSLPTRLLDRVLQNEGLRAEVLRVALSRNDSKKYGVTRRELLEERLAGCSLTPQDTVVLVDEWLSGANFRNLTELLAKVASVRTAAFLPVALLTDRSASQDRYGSHCEEHDRHMSRVGEHGAAFRFTFPRLGSRFERDGYFFWSEHDRLAGYRKFQPLGALLSSIEELVERMKHEPELRRRARAEVVAEIARDPEYSGEAPEVTAGAVGDGGVLDRLFEESYEDYQRCRDELRRLTAPAAPSEDSGFAAALGGQVAPLHEIIDDRPAKVCVLMALFLIESDQLVDSPDQFYLRGQAPAVVDLGESFGRLSECVLKELFELTRGCREALARG